MTPRTKLVGLGLKIPAFPGVGRLTLARKSDLRWTFVSVGRDLANAGRLVLTRRPAKRQRRVRRTVRELHTISKFATKRRFCGQRSGFNRPRCFRRRGCSKTSASAKLLKNDAPAGDKDPKGTCQIWGKTATYPFTDDRFRLVRPGPVCIGWVIGQTALFLDLRGSNLDRRTRKGSLLPPRHDDRFHFFFFFSSSFRQAKGDGTLGAKTRPHVELQGRWAQRQAAIKQNTYARLPSQVGKDDGGNAGGN